MKTNKLKQQKGTLLRVLQYVKPYRVLVIVSLLCACVSAAAQLLIPILTGKAIDQMIGAGQVNLPGVLVFAAALDEDIPQLREIYGENLFEVSDLARMPKTLLNTMKRFIK